MADEIPGICGHRWTGPPGSHMPDADRQHWCTHLDDHTRQGRPHECCCGAVAETSGGTAPAYVRCTDPGCQHHRDGWEHGHPRPTLAP